MPSSSKQHQEQGRRRRRVLVQPARPSAAMTHPAAPPHPLLGLRCQDAPGAGRVRLRTLGGGRRSSPGDLVAQQAGLARRSGAAAVAEGRYEVLMNQLPLRAAVLGSAAALATSSITPRRKGHARALCRRRCVAAHRRLARPAIPEKSLRCWTFCARAAAATSSSSPPALWRWRWLAMIGTCCACCAASTPKAAAASA